MAVGGCSASRDGRGGTSSSSKSPNENAVSDVLSNDIKETRISGEGDENWRRAEQEEKRKKNSERKGERGWWLVGCRVLIGSVEVTVVCKKPGYCYGTCAAPKPRNTRGGWWIAKRTGRDWAGQATSQPSVDSLVNDWERQ